MSLTTSQIDVQFRRLYKENSTRFFDSSWEVTAINDSCEDILEELLNVNSDYSPIKLQTIGYSSGQREYTLPTDFAQGVKLEVNDIGGPPFPLLQKIRFSDIGTIASLPFNIAWTTTGLGEPGGYYIRFLESGQKPIGSSTAVTTDLWVVGFDPVPGRTATANVNLWYTAVTSPVTGIDSELPDLPADLHYLIPRRMCVLAALADQSPSLEMYKALYNDSLMRKLNRVVRSPQIASEVIELDWET